MEGGEERNMEGRNRNNDKKKKKKKSDSAATATDDKSKKKQQQQQQQKQPIKVVYISNPMKVKATVDEFRSVVQGLTGRDSDIESSLSKYGDDGGPELPEEEPCDGSAGADLSGEASTKQEGEYDHFDDDELPEFLPSPPAYFELQGTKRMRTPRTIQSTHCCGACPGLSCCTSSANKLVNMFKIGSAFLQLPFRNGLLIHHIIIISLP